LEPEAAAVAVGAQLTESPIGSGSAVSGGALELALNKELAHGLKFMDADDEVDIGFVADMQVAVANDDEGGASLT
jgi:hypothetical protein